MRVAPEYYLSLAGLMFVIGVVGALIRRNAIVIFMFVELMLNAVNLAFVTFARMWGHVDGQVLVFFSGCRGRRGRGGTCHHPVDLPEKGFGGCGRRQSPEMVTR